MTLDVDTTVGVAVHPDHGDEAEVAAPAGRPGGPRGQESPTRSSCSTPAWSRARCAGSAWPATCGGPWRRRDRGLLPAQGRAADRRVVGVECLARWEHPAHGQVPRRIRRRRRAHRPAGRLTEVVLGEACAGPGVGRRRPVAVGRRQPVRPYPDGPRFPDPGRRAARRVRRAGRPAHVGGRRGRHAGRPPTVRWRRCGGCADSAFALSVDDFGTGYSSLSYLRKLPVTRSRSTSLRPGHGDRPRRPRIVRAVVGLSRHFGLAVVAEGVESELTLSCWRRSAATSARASCSAGRCRTSVWRPGSGAHRAGKHPRARSGCGSARSPDAQMRIRFHPAGAVYSYPCSARDRARPLSSVGRASPW